MEERFVAPAAIESRPLEDPAGAPGAPRAPGPERAGAGITDPRALQILSTEHWSLLTARSLVYNEAFARGGMFLSFLSATLLVLGLISTASGGFSDPFLIVAALVLALDLFVGLATLGRISGASSEDLRYLQGMNRLRHAYFEIVPGLDDYFITSPYDDFESVAGFYGPGVEATNPLQGVAHGLTTMPGMIGVICNALGGMLVAVLTLLATHDATLAGVAGVATFLALLVLLSVLAFRQAMRFAISVEPKFPKPGWKKPGS
jgi:hypothetical protein